MARDFSLKTTVPAPRIPIGYAEFNGNRIPVYVSEDWRLLWFEKVSPALFGPTGEDDVTQGLNPGGTVTLGSGTDGDYVKSISGDGSKGVVVTGGSGEGSTPVVSLSQDLQASASPTFANISVTGNVDGRDVSADGAALDALPASIAGKVTKAVITALPTSGTSTIAELEAKINEIAAAMNA